MNDSPEADYKANGGRCPSTSRHFTACDLNLPVPAAPVISAAIVIATLVTIFVSLAIGLLVIILVAVAAVVAPVGMSVIAVMRGPEAVAAGAVIAAIVKAVLVTEVARVGNAPVVVAGVPTVV